MADRSDVLNTIVINKQKELAQRKELVALNDLKATAKPSKRSLESVLAKPGNRFILEYKRASPSRGDICKDLTIEQCLKAYEASADAYSVLTDKRFFNGNHILLKALAERTDKPVLCKDFFIDLYQVYEARVYGADAILLMLSVLDDERYRELAEVAHSLSLDIITEVHTEEECRRAVALDAKIIGINNRNLKTLDTRLETTEQLNNLIPEGCLVISESGISSRADINRLAQYVDGFLVGSSLMSAESIELATKKLVYGEVKICGIQTAESAQLCVNRGASYVGLMFYNKSPRYIDATTAEFITHQINGNYVGVFVNESPSRIIDRVSRCQLSVVQCHGTETLSQIRALRKILPSKVKIWKALGIDEALSFNELRSWLTVVDKVVVDYQTVRSYGGNGKRFDWELLSELFNSVEQDRIVIAGGISASNVTDLQEFTKSTLDLSSGVEKSRGVKDTSRIAEFFEQCRMNGKQGI
ncbi:bifunctional indole-3-glycerol-phosphate synthase TrpC/phosphoribosylanthranilate isomerase TrpF [Pleionea sediminis]|uniref:bifunctional indole-3-glycerol-phosphate synthase TrpC/phosphoribosylanthranilate isomerase TrpF n=1 Tax=Pleionea sediminis TaxID=2569479 RepID=UPI001185C764|nr:bifunctional indole-3-glycerol-phosphate synthase TrpC/phosphoribosylanthranilate isomerase TrpF [Pleionea sediminis]